MQDKKTCLPIAYRSFEEALRIL